MEKTEIIARAESLMPKEWGDKIRLHVEETYENATATVIRCRLAHVSDAAPASVTVKYVSPLAENPTGNRHSFLNDWAACLFLNSFQHDPPLAPRFYAGDTEQSILVMEDLGAGDGPSTMALLEGSDPDLAALGLVEHAALIGQLHGATVGRVDDYIKVRERLGPLPPHPELYGYPWSNTRRQRPLAWEINQAIERYHTVRERLGLVPQSGADDEIEVATLRVEGDEGPFLAYCKGDQNLPGDFIRCDARLRLFDYGEGGYRHALIEGMPGRFTWGCMMRIPQHLVSEMEAAYRTHLVRGCQEATDDTVLRNAMADAGARWHLFHALTRVPIALEEDYQRGPTTLRQQVVAWVDSFADLSEETRSYSALGRSAREMSTRLRAMWRTEETSLPYYPAFSSLT